MSLALWRRKYKPGYTPSASHPNEIQLPPIHIALSSTLNHEANNYHPAIPRPHRTQVKFSYHPSASHFVKPCITKPTTIAQLHPDHFALRKQPGQPHQSKPTKQPGNQQSTKPIPICLFLQSATCSHTSNYYQPR